MRDSAGCRAHKSGGLVGMQPSLTQQQRTGGLTLPDSRGSFSRRKRNSVLVTVSLLIVSILILTVGLAATTRTQNVTVGGYYPGIILGFGSFLGIIGANLIENKRQMLVASIVFISFGVIAAFCCAIVDGVFAARHIDVRPLYAGRCQYHSKVTSYISDDHLSDVICQAFPRGPCSLKIKSNTCYCCDLYNCGRVLQLQQSPALQSQHPHQQHTIRDHSILVLFCHPPHLVFQKIHSLCHNLLQAICGHHMHLLGIVHLISHQMKSLHPIHLSEFVALKDEHVMEKHFYCVSFGRKAELRPETFETI
ncbi:transmembrane protein 255A isoform X3 [Protopterus annectens]|uniref:transmembrane protein 255A isoform X3 n=1 Tax=Protopterus annectens TaxID=7888 RepID=UPI001CFADD1D|nr:transmembrane protein 255A isoform X3 [Protopterus annectens]